jgi:hypothetical protein
MAYDLRLRIKKMRPYKIAKQTVKQRTLSTGQNCNQQIGKKIFTNPTSDRGLISNTFKEIKKLDSRESSNSIKKWGTELNKEFFS